LIPGKQLNHKSGLLDRFIEPNWHCQMFPAILIALRQQQLTATFFQLHSSSQAYKHCNSVCCCCLVDVVVLLQFIGKVEVKEREVNCV